MRKKLELLKKLSILQKEKDGFFNTVLGLLSAAKDEGICKEDLDFFKNLQIKCGLLQSNLNDIQNILTKERELND